MTLDALNTAIAIAAWITLCLLVWAGFELVAYLRWQRFLKLLDERLGDRSDGSRLPAPDDLKAIPDHVSMPSFVRERN